MLLIEEGKSRQLHELDAIEVPKVAPWAAARGGATDWRPINHGVLARAVIQTAEDGGLVVKEAHWATNPSETDLFGSIVFGPSRGSRVPKGLSLAMGLRHSNAGRYAVTFGFGAQVDVCTNGMFIGEHIVSHKHTKDLRVETLVEEGFAQLLERAPEVGKHSRRLKAKRIGNATADRLIVEAGRRGVLPWSQLGKVEEQWRDPDHSAFRGRNAWSLYNAFTEVAKGRSPSGQLSSLRKLVELFEARSLARMAR